MLSDEQFDRVRALALSIAGIELVDRHRDLLHSRSRRLGSTGAALDGLLTAAEHHDPEAIRKLIGLLTTKFTGFFRHPKHFIIAAEHAKHVTEQCGKAHLWSCGAATGEEPYSLAITLIEAFDRDEPPVSILATDVDSESLIRAERGEYPESIESLSPARRSRFFSTNAESKTTNVGPNVRRLVTFKQLNLADSQWGVDGPFDVILCRNVMMYMESERRVRVLENLTRYMAPNALFIIDPTENLGKAASLFEQREEGIYSLRNETGYQTNREWAHSGMSGGQS